MRQRVLIVDNSKYVTGALQSIAAYAQILRGQIDFHFAIPPSAVTMRFLRERQFKYHIIPFVELERSAKTLIYPISLIRNTLRIMYIIQKNQITIIHVNDLYNMTGIVVKLFRPGIKVLYHIRLLPTSYAGRLFYAWSYLIGKFADRIFCVSNAVYKEFKIKDLSKKVLLFDAMVFEVDRSVKNHFRDNKIKRLLYVANFVRGKGHNFALEVFNKLAGQNEDVNITFVGNYDAEDSYFKAFKRKIQSFSLKDRVELYGFEQNMSKMYLRADVFLNFSVSESFSMTCLEASHYSLPVVAFKSGGPGEIVQHGKSGFLLEELEINRAVDYINQLLYYEEKRKRFGQNGKKYVKSKFNVKVL